MNEPHFWEDGGKAKEMIEKANRLRKWINPYNDLVQRLENVTSIYPEAEEVKDATLLLELDQEVLLIEKGIADLELQKMFSKEMDSRSCFFSINAGAGGTESCDWVMMLCRMYTRWAEKKGWQVEVVDRVEGEIAGIKSITYRFSGDFCYGYCKSEKGVHRLIRISPFDSNARRHTSFASVDVSPIIEDVAIEIRPEDLRVDTYRASGAGGQHVNKTDSAVRMTHLPTGIVVCCQSERSQIQNRETCLKMLSSKLYEKDRLEKQEALQKLSGEKKENSWGSQIRNYVFQPYTLVKDTRTKVESGNIQAVMDGEIDLFVEAYLKEFG